MCVSLTLLLLCAALLEYFLKLDEKEAAKRKPETPLPIKVSGISGGLAADLFRNSKNFDAVVSNLAVRVSCLLSLVSCL